jgi:hypothetical protein
MTNSRIAVVQHDNTIKSIYCNFDGYLKGVGSILFNNFKTYDSVNNLMNIGNIITLYSNSRYIVPYENTKCVVHSNLDEYIDYIGKETFNYLFKEDMWFVYQENEWIALNKKMVNKR